ncbi:ABC transporter ATP-binding protein/permease [Demequina zhanjiangensis]|uniref:ABC transporter transmembrane domain-containing protein n=1 Tax=Demequina zhanjiangensis TaxID=3051659 RepID=A0ABT8G4R5_9MICO|nr:ABC transporter transmembrane domain-containing protein [Demequina sp. SYSU T00b26]MDN4474133.1 ABC transporter transmembrane domain-containing protein [Demequina sp. SYSU T00b26]
MKPIDPRLVVRIGPARRYILVTAGLGLLTALLVAVQALLIARMLAPVLAPTPLTGDGLGWLGTLVPTSARELSSGLPLLAGVIALRTLTSWLQERLAHRAGAQVISELRSQVVAHAAAMGPRWIASGRGADVVTVVSRGLDDLLPYFVRYLPQLALASTLTPILIVLVLGLDWLSALIVTLTLPLVPIFMILVGLVTRERSEKHLKAMQTLGARTLDLIAGVPTLKALGRERGPAARVRELGEAHRKATMGSLRVAFLSGMVLELLTTLAVAIVAVTMGFRLVEGGIGIETALAVLILAPEVYLPVRNVGTHFHASADGLAAADAAFEILDEPLPAMGGDAPAPDAARGAIVVTGVGIATPDGVREAPSGADVRCSPGTLTAIVGANGSGKSTLLLALAGLLPPTAGRISLETGSAADDAPERDAEVVAQDGALLVDADGWAKQIAWVPQRPDLGPAGRTLSLGQRQRVALDRAFESGRPVLLLDEPTAHLDPDSRDQIVERMRALAASGATVVVATHEPDVVHAADEVLTVESREITEVSA